MTQPLSQHIEATPAARVNAAPFGGELARFERHLAAENKSPRTIRTYGDSARQLHAFLEAQGMPLALEHVRREHIEAFIITLLERWKSSTANHRYRALLAFFKYADEEGLVSESPMARMSPPKVQESLVPVLSEDELRTLLKTVSGTDFEARRDAAILRVFIDTGARLSEVAGLRLGHPDALDDADSDLDLNGALLRVLGKDNRWRMLPLGAQTRRVIDRYLRIRGTHPRADDPALWLGRRGKLGPSGVSQMVGRRGTEAGLPDLHPHQFRHTVAHHWQAQGGEGADLMRIMGWSSPSMLQRYAQSAAEERAIAAHRRGLGLGDRL